MIIESAPGPAVLRLPRQAVRAGIVALPGAWRASGAAVTIADLPGCGHWPVVGSGQPGYSGWDDDRFSADLESTLTTWLTGQLNTTAR